MPAASCARGSSPTEERTERVNASPGAAGLRGNRCAGAGFRERLLGQHLPIPATILASPGMKGWRRPVELTQPAGKAGVRPAVKDVKAVSGLRAKEPLKTAAKIATGRPKSTSRAGAKSEPSKTRRRTLATR